MGVILGEESKVMMKGAGGIHRILDAEADTDGVEKRGLKGLLLKFQQNLKSESTLNRTFPIPDTSELKRERGKVVGVVENKDMGCLNEPKRNLGKLGGSGSLRVNVTRG